MESRKALLDKAATVCGSRYALSKRLDVSQAELSNMAHGKRPIGPRLAARLAAIAGEDPRNEALAALVDQESDPEIRQELARLFKLAPALAIVITTMMGNVFPSPAEAAETHQNYSTNNAGPMCIM